MLPICSLDSEIFPGEQHCEACNHSLTHSQHESCLHLPLNLHDRYKAIGALERPSLLGALVRCRPESGGGLLFKTVSSPSARDHDYPGTEHVQQPTPASIYRAAAFVVHFNTLTGNNAECYMSVPYEVQCSAQVCAQSPTLTQLASVVRPLLKKEKPLPSLTISSWSLFTASKRVSPTLGAPGNGAIPMFERTFRCLGRGAIAVTVLNTGKAIRYLPELSDRW